MARVLQWYCALFFVLITVFCYSECRRSGGGRRVSIRTYTYRKPKPSYQSPSSSSGSSTSRRYPGYPIHQGHGGYAAFPGGFGPGPGGFGRFSSYESKYRNADSNTFDSSILWLSLYTLTRDVNHYHFYYPNSIPAKNIPDRGSFSTQVGNMTCISTYNAKPVNKWATDTLNDLNKVFPKTNSSVYGNGTQIGVYFTVVPGEIVHNETLGVTCCGTAKGFVNLAVITSGRDPDVNCMFKQFNMPFRKLKFIPVNSTSTNGTDVNNTTRTTNATVMNVNSNNTTARNFTVPSDSNSTTANTTVASNSNNITATNTTISSNSNNITATNTIVSSNTNNITATNTTISSNNNNRTATNSTISSNNNNRTATNTIVSSNTNNRTATNTTVILNSPISTSDNSTFPDARINTVLPTENSTTVVPINAETHIQSIQRTTKASLL
ncbi:hypothetical protein CBL_00061 [Carabus blaptoides fortunei]